MTSADQKNLDSDNVSETRPKRILQYIGAALATAFVLWFLFGIPAYILYSSYFG